MEKPFNAVKLLLWFKIILLYCASIGPVFCQNLVVNGNFEQVIKEPCRFIIPFPQETLANYFFNWTTPTGGTADPWSYKDTINFDCTQNLKSLSINAHSGKYCSGIYTSANKFKNISLEPVYREYLQTKLLKPLQIGKVYLVKLYCRRNPYSGTNTNNLGFYFSEFPTIKSVSYTDRLENIPQVNFSKIIEADKDWVKVSGCFTAKKAYEYLTIGNFFDDKSTSFQNASLPNRDERPYYLIDDVEVLETPIEQLPSANFLGPDTTLCPKQSLNLLASQNSGISYYHLDGTPINTYIVNKAGLYYAMAKAYECIVEDTVKILVEKEIRLLPDTSICSGEKLILMLDHADGRYEWNSGSNDSSITVSQSGIYWVKIPSLICNLIDSIKVDFFDCSVNVPNVITPNNDGINDNFVIQTNKGTVFKWKLEIYNRWGSLVYFTDEYNNDWSAYGLPSGTYYYTLFDKIKLRLFKGWVTVLL